MKILLRLAFLLILSLPVLSASAQQWKNFYDTSIAFIAKYPPSWVNKIKEDKRVFFTSPSDGASDTFLENVNIGISQNPAFGVTLLIKDAVPSILENVESAFTEFKLEKERYFTWNKSSACEIIYTGFIKTSPDIRLRMTQWFCFYKTRLYTVTFTSLTSTSIHTANARKIMSGIIFK
ncbi:MAG: hypothetical protein ABIR30_12615 [Chitinophagaceae bacterium]